MDDVISLWNYGENELRGFLDHLYTYDRNLQFTLEIEIANKISFLDVLNIHRLYKPILLFTENQHKTKDIYILRQTTPHKLGELS